MTSKLTLSGGDDRRKAAVTSSVMTTYVGGDGGGERQRPEQRKGRHAARLRGHDGAAHGDDFLPGDPVTALGQSFGRRRNATLG
jgi:hypothetical protein